MRMAGRREGICRLTGEPGRFVDAHILPKALTYPAEKGLPFAQAGDEHPPIKRWSSWYDPAIVTRAGEDILAEYDNFAVAELRTHRLVWSGWDGADALVSDDYVPMPPMPGIPGGGLRVIHGVDGPRLRLFFLSLLWRAAISRLPEFGQIDIRSSDLRRLRRILLARDPAPLSFYPISLHQIVARGAIHNHTPVAERRPLNIGRLDGPTLPIFRFYLDGLVAHIHRPGAERHIAPLMDRMLGGGEPLVVTTTDFDSSRQRETVAGILADTSRRWPDRLSRIPGFADSAST
ncbi:hypothetical protein QE385_003173 [Sphingomonas sp. SORGH_AS 950]|nr:hypothetical protein [Sphingomonas sp. SORGH_AS_0950]